MQSIIAQIAEGEVLSEAQVNEAVEFLTSASAEVPLKKDFLSGLNKRGETSTELAFFAKAFLEKAVRPNFQAEQYSAPVIDVCGTGGDHLNLFNVSTTSMFVLAEAGAIVVKHGNKGVTSKSGSSDVLQALGIRADLPPEQFGEVIDQAGVAFMWAPIYHPAFKEIMPVRMELAKEGKKTLFNLMGPLLNPVQPSHQLIGVYAESLVSKFAEILNQLGRKKAWVVHGTVDDGRVVDEMSLSGKSVVAEVNQGQVSTPFDVTPESLGLAKVDPEALAGGDAEENAEMLIGLLKGDIQGARADMVALNAGAAMVAAGLVADLQAGVLKSQEILSSGAAFSRLEKLQAACK